MVNVAPRGNYKHNPLYIDVPPETEYTGGDLVRGVVRVDPTLRPQHISICFTGYANLHDHDTSNCAKAVFFEYSQNLFTSAGQHGNLDILRIGTAKDGKVELPFQFTFPSTVQLPPPEDRIWVYSEDSYDHPRFQHSPGFSLPPTLQPDIEDDTPSAPRITYSVEANMESSVPRMKVRQDLKFVPVPPEYDRTLLQPHPELGTKLPKHCSPYKLIRTRKLLPSYENSSKREKLRDLFVEKELFFTTFTEVPFAKFLILATAARVLVLGNSVPIVLTVRHLDRSSSLENPPELFMRRVRVRLLSTLSIFIPRLANSKGPRKENIEYIRGTTTLFDRKFDQGHGEPLYNGLNLSDIGDIKLTPGKQIPSFTSYGMELEYEIQVEVWGECAKHECSGIVCKDQIQIVPEWVARPPPQDSVIDEMLPPQITDPGPPYQESDPLSTPLGPVDLGEDFTLQMTPHTGSRPLPEAESQQRQQDSRTSLQGRRVYGLEDQRASLRPSTRPKPPPYVA